MTRYLLEGGVVLSLDPDVGDFERADVLVEDDRIVAIGPDLGAVGEVVDCSGLVVMPGFIQTHHHQYETVMRAIIPDGLLFGPWPQESYFSVVQDIWTAGRIGDPTNPVWDLGRPPLDPEDVYLAELVASLSLIAQGVTMTADTSQSSHTAEYTDAMIQGLVGSGQRALFVYSPGIDRGGYEFPGRMGDSTRGIGRIADRFFTSKDQLVTLGAGMYPGTATATTPAGSSRARTTPTSPTTTSAWATSSSTRRPTPATATTGPTSPSSRMRNGNSSSRTSNSGCAKSSEQASSARTDRREPGWFARVHTRRVIRPPR